MKKTLILSLLLTSSFSFAHSNCNVDVIYNISSTPAIEKVVQSALLTKNYTQTNRDSADTVLEISEIRNTLGLTTRDISISLKNLKNERAEITTAGRAEMNIILAMINSEKEQSRTLKSAVKNSMVNLLKLIPAQCK